MTMEETIISISGPKTKIVKWQSWSYKQNSGVFVYLPLKLSPMNFDFFMFVNGQSDFLSFTYIDIQYTMV